jgi:hypothetical protein
MMQAKECAPTPYPSIVFTFGFAVEFIKEFRGASYTRNVNPKPYISL